MDWNWYDQNPSCHSGSKKENHSWGCEKGIHAWFNCVCIYCSLDYREFEQMKIVWTKNKPAESFDTVLEPVSEPEQDPVEQVPNPTAKTEIPTIIKDTLDSPKEEKKRSKHSRKQSKLRTRPEKREQKKEISDSAPAKLEGFRREDDWRAELELRDSPESCEVYEAPPEEKDRRNFIVSHFSSDSANLKEVKVDDPRLLVEDKPSELIPTISMLGLDSLQINRAAQLETHSNWTKESQTGSGSPSSNQPSEQGLDPNPIFPQNKTHLSKFLTSIPEVPDEEILKPISPEIIKEAVQTENLEIFSVEENQTDDLQIPEEVHLEVIAEEVQNETLEVMPSEADETPDCSEVAVVGEVSELQFALDQFIERSRQEVTPWTELYFAYKYFAKFGVIPSYPPRVDKVEESVPNSEVKENYSENNQLEPNENNSTIAIASTEKFELELPTQLVDQPIAADNNDDINTKVGKSERIEPLATPESSDFDTDDMISSMRSKAKLEPGYTADGGD